MTGQLEILKQNIDNLSKSDKEFAQSMLNQYEQHDLSSKQMFWVGKLIERATAPKPQPKTVDVGSFTGVIALFDQAKKYLKHPQIKLQTEDGRPVCLSVAGPNSKAPGTVNVTDGRPYGQNDWYGRVTKEGMWEQSQKAHASLEPLMKALSRHPAETAATYGKLTGRCCFCNLKLSDERSTAVGYGQTCAKNYGLPWGKK